MGIAALVLGALGGLFFCLTMAITTYLVATNEAAVMNSDTTLAMIGIAILCGGGINLLGIGLGIVGVAQPQAKKLFGILGLVVNVLVLCGILAILVIGQI